MCSKKTPKDINVEALNIITNKNETEAMTEHILCNCKCKFNSTIGIQIKNGIIKHVHLNVKIIVHVKKIILGNLAHALVRIVSI